MQYKSVQGCYFYIKIESCIGNLATFNFRDLKPRNILVDEDENFKIILKLADFGVSCSSKLDSSSSVVGTENYVSPEVIKKEKYSEKVDVFSFGCILYKLATFKEKLFYMEVSNEETMSRIYTEIKERYTDTLAEIIIRCLLNDPESRPSSNDCLNALLLLKDNPKIDRKVLFSTQRSIEKVSIIGCGFIGVKLAIEFARCGIHIMLYEKSDNYIEKGKRTIENTITNFQKQGLINFQSGDIAQRITITSKLAEAVKDADFVIECIAEVFETKKSVIDRLDSLLPENIPLATTSLSLSLEKLSENIKEKHRFLGLRLILPIYFISMVEYSKTELTSPKVIQTVNAFFKRIKKELFERSQYEEQLSVILEMNQMKTLMIDNEKNHLKYCKDCNQIATIVIIPCGHITHCKKCIEKIKTCIKCQGNIESFIEAKF